MIIAHWAPWFRQHYGGVLPDDYLCFDTETSGFSRQHDLVLEWGHCLVRNRKPENRLNVLINWYDHPGVDAAWLDNQLLQIKDNMTVRNRDWHITPERLQREGLPPEQVFTWLDDLLQTFFSQDIMFVCHNGVRFDAEMLYSSSRKAINKPLVFPKNRLFDTGAVVKASQMIEDSNVLPRTGETMEDYFRRVADIVAPGTKWNLDQYCMQTFNLQRFGIDADKMHDAGEDAYALHFLFEEFRRLTVEVKTPTLPGPVASPKAMRPTVLADPPRRTSSGEFRGQRNR